MEYFKIAGNSVKLMLKNPSLYIPDLIYYAATAVLAYAFLYFNGLTGIFSGLDIFTLKIREIASSNLLGKLITTFVVFVVLNFIIGLGTISLRYTLIKQLVENHKTNFSDAYKRAGRYVISLFALKILLSLIYLAPIAVFGIIAIVYKSLLIPMIILAILSIIILRFIFLFVYPALFLKIGGGAAKTIKNSSEYFNKNVVHTILTGLFIFAVSVIIGLISNNLLSSYSIFPLLQFNFIIIFAVVARVLINISLIIWGALFLFKNY